MARYSVSAAIMVAVAVCRMPVAAEQTPVPTAVWAPKPVEPPGYAAPQRPWIRLADVKAAHAGQTDWTMLLVDDGRLTAEYVSAAPRSRVGRRFHPDTREWFAVVEGAVRVEIEGQPPFVATRGSLVNIPRQTIYALETVGSTPSLRFTVNVSRARTPAHSNRLCSVVRDRFAAIGPC
jgi:quercetin dioxygenase-like cupin family protein